MKKFLKKNMKTIIVGVLCLLTGSGITYATVINSIDVAYDNSNSTLSATTVQGAIDELYNRSSTSCSAGIVTVNKGTGVSSVTGGGMYQKGSSVTIGYTMNTGYHFKNITGDVTTKTFTMPGKDVSATVNGEINKYYVSYDACGGSGAPSKTTHTYGTSSNISSTQPTNGDKTFQGWSKTSCSGSVDLSSGASISNLTTTNEATVPLYAIWKSPSCEYKCSNGWYATYTNGTMTSCRYSGDYGSAVCNGGFNGSSYALFMCQGTTSYSGYPLTGYCNTSLDTGVYSINGGSCPSSYTCP